MSTMSELSLVKDGKMSFCISRDPDNNPTDGINRYDCSNLTHMVSHMLDGMY